MQHVHDCDKCVSLGEWKDYDLYYCEQGESPTVIGRYGEGDRYTSGFTFVRTIPALAVAEDRAIQRGLIKENL